MTTDRQPTGLNARWPLLAALAIAVGALIISLLAPFDNEATTATVLTAAFTGAYFFLTWSLVRSQQATVRQVESQVELLRAQVDEARVAREEADARSEEAIRESRESRESADRRALESLAESRRQSELAAKQAAESVQRSTRGHLDSVGPVLSVILLRDKSQPEVLVRWNKFAAIGDAKQFLLDDRWQTLDSLGGREWLEAADADAVMVKTSLTFQVSNSGPVPVLLFLPSPEPGELTTSAPVVGGYGLIEEHSKETVTWEYTSNVSGWARVAEQGFGMVGREARFSPSTIRITLQTTDTMNRVTDTFEWTGEARLAERDGSRTRLLKPSVWGFPAALLRDRIYHFEAQADDTAQDEG